MILHLLVTHLPCSLRSLPATLTASRSSQHEFVVNPTHKEMEESKLHLTIAGTEKAVLMIEGRADFLTEEQVRMSDNLRGGVYNSLRSSTTNTTTIIIIQPFSASRHSYALRSAYRR